MSLFSNKPTPISQEDGATSSLFREEENNIKSDREFWEDCVKWMMDYELRAQDVERIIAVADELTKARRERFPVNG
jgi:hypothetical protein